MTTLTYTATRNIAPATNFVSFLDAVDISFDSADNSINSVTTDLSGLLAGDWVEVGGSGDNDGWHQLDQGSTGTKIIANVNTTIVDGIAGEPINITGYLHGLGEIYTLETASHVLDQSYSTQQRNSISLSGVKETLLHHETEFWNILTDFLTEAEMSYWREMVSSVRAGETFSVDIYGTIAVPEPAISVTLEGDPTTRRVNSATRQYQYSMKVRRA